MAREFEPTTQLGYTYKQGEAECRANADKFRKLADKWKESADGEFRIEADQYQRAADWYQKQATDEADAWWESRLIDPVQESLQPVQERKVYTRPDPTTDPAAQKAATIEQCRAWIDATIPSSKPPAYQEIITGKPGQPLSSPPEWLQLTLVGLSLAAPVVSIVIWIFTQS